MLTFELYQHIDISHNPTSNAVFYHPFSDKIPQTSCNAEEGPLNKHLFTLITCLRWTGQYYWKVINVVKLYSYYTGSVQNKALQQSKQIKKKNKVFKFQASGKTNTKVRILSLPIQSLISYVFPELKFTFLST